MSLNTRKIYCDTRFRAPESKSNSDFIIDLPVTVEIPDGTVCYLNDFVIPVSFTVCDYRNRNLYFSINFLSTLRYYTFQVEEKNYNGDSLGIQLEAKFAEVLTPEMFLYFKIRCATNYVDNNFIISISDYRTNGAGEVCTIIIYSDTDLKNGLWNNQKLDKPYSMNNLLTLNTSPVITNFNMYLTHLDLHSTRNLYLHSSTLNNYDIISNWNCDTIIKKIPVRASYNELIFDSQQQGFDNLRLDKTSFNKINFWLTDSYNNIMDLKGSHFSFSILFQLKN